MWRRWRELARRPSLLQRLSGSENGLIRETERDKEGLAHNLLGDVMELRGPRLACGSLRAKVQEGDLSMNAVVP